MAFRLAADLIVAVHFGYVAFVVFGVLMTIIGGLLQWDWVKNRWFRGIHLAMILIVVLEAWAGITCPLTTWENEMRGAAGDLSYEGGFIANWLHDAMFFQADPWVFTLGYTIFGLLVIATWIFIPPRRPVRKA